MKNFKYTIIIIFLLISFCFSASYLIAQESQKEKISNLSNQDKILEQKIDQSNDRIESLKEYSNWKFDSLNEKIDDVRILLFVLIGTLATLIGFIIYDRKAALSPLEIRIKNLESRHEMIIATLQGMANNDFRLIELLHSVRGPDSELSEEKIELLKEKMELMEKAADAKDNQANAIVSKINQQNKQLHQLIEKSKGAINQRNFAILKLGQALDECLLPKTYKGKIEKIRKNILLKTLSKETKKQTINYDDLFYELEKSLEEYLYGDEEDDS